MSASPAGAMVTVELHTCEVSLEERINVRGCKARLRGIEGGVTSAGLPRNTTDLQAPFQRTRTCFTSQSDFQE